MLRKKDTPHSSRKARILVVDADPTICDLLRTHFGPDGYEVVGHENYNKLSSTDISKYALVIINLDLGDSSFALRLVEQISQQKSTAHTGVITCSTNMSPSRVIDSLNSGADDYLLKPFSLRELMARVRAVLRRYSR